MNRQQGSLGIAVGVLCFSLMGCGTRLASRNLDAIAKSRETWRALNIGLHALTIGTSWARIEAGWHYPSDTLFSIALGNFIASFVNDAFLGLDGNVSVSLAPVERGATARLHVRF